MAQARRKDGRPKDASRRMSLDHAARRLVKNGDAAIRAIAAACGMRAGSLSHHFPTKEVLIEEALAEGVRGVDLRVRETLKVALFGLMNRTLEWRHPPDARPGDMADRIFRIAFQGVRHG